MTDKPPAYSLRDVAKMLRRSERFVWNLIREGRIRAAKNGKSWELDAASVMAFAHANGIRVEGDDPRAALPPVPPPPASAPGPRAEAKAAHEEKRRDRYTFQELGAWEALRAPAIDGLRLLSGLPADACPVARHRAEQTLVAALEHLAVGYNTFHLREKALAYGHAREAVAAAASALCVLAEMTPAGQAASELASRLEGDTIRAIGGLVSMTEKKHERRDRPGS